MKPVTSAENPCEVLFFENSGSCKNKQDEKNPPLESVRWLTSKEAAQYLRVSVSSLKMMVYRGQVRVRKLGRRNRFLREELDRLFTSPNLKKEK
jgi:excisionase family DNA binding protein